MYYKCTILYRNKCFEAIQYEIGAPLYYVLLTIVLSSSHTLDKSNHFELQNIFVNIDQLGASLKPL